MVGGVSGRGAALSRLTGVQPARALDDDPASGQLGGAATSAGRSSPRSGTLAAGRPLGRSPRVAPRSLAALLDLLLPGHAAAAPRPGRGWCAALRRPARHPCVADAARRPGGARGGPLHRAAAHGAARATRSAAAATSPRRWPGTPPRAGRGAVRPARRRAWLVPAPSRAGRPRGPAAATTCSGSAAHLASAPTRPASGSRRCSRSPAAPATRSVSTPRSAPPTSRGAFAYATQRYRRRDRE